MRVIGNTSINNMRRIIINSLTMTNFKGEKERKTVFNDGQTFIYGANGTGKSRHYDAFLWLLFGKDALDRQDYEIKTVVNGEPLHKVDSSVQGIFTVDGEKLTLKRTLVEDWVKPRGQSEQVFKGNHTDYEWNGVPVSATEYRRRVCGIVDDTVFKMLSNPEYFASMPWQSQREILFSMADVPDDIEVAMSDKSLSSLIDRITGKSVQDYRNELLSAKKRLNKELSDIQPRIDQTVKLIPDADDFDSIEKRIAEIEKEKQSIDCTISDRKKSVADAEAKQRDILSEVSSIRDRQRKIVSELTAAANERYESSMSEIRKVRSQLSEAESACSRIESERKSIAESLVSRKSTLSDMRNEIERIRKEYTDEYAVKFTRSTVCPYCGNDLPDRIVTELVEKFEAEKNRRLDEITARGKSLGSRIENTEKEISSMESMLSELESKSSRALLDADTLKKVLDSMPVPEIERVNPSDSKEWGELESQASSLLESVPDSSVDLSDLQVRRSEIERERISLTERLAKKAMIERFHNEISELDRRGRELSQSISDVEREENLIATLTRKKIDICESRVNSMFSMVRFSLYSYTNEGNPVETCIPFVDGVPYGTANTARRINAGLDIINALQRYYGISVPVFLDNRERVNEVIPIDAQTVHMFVTNDKELIVK